MGRKATPDARGAHRARTPRRSPRRRRHGAQAGLAASHGDARRLILQGGVSVNGERFADVQGGLGAGEYVVRVGKRRFVRLRIA